MFVFCLHGEWSKTPGFLFIRAMDVGRKQSFLWFIFYPTALNRLSGRNDVLLDYISLQGDGWCFLQHFWGNVNRLYSLRLEQDADPAPQQLQSASQRACLTYQSQVAFFALWSYITLSVITWKECRVHRLLLNLPRLARCQGAVWWSGLRQQVMFGLMLRDQVGRLISVCYWQEVRLLTEGLGRARSSSLCADRRLAPESQDALRRHTRPAWHWHECFLSRWWSLSQHYVE